MTTPAQLARQHRFDSTSILIVGGVAARRLAVANAFHRASTTQGAFVCLDADREQGRLRGLLLACAGLGVADGPHPLALANHGTLFIDSIDALADDTQRLLLHLIAHTRAPLGGPTEATWVGRLVVGCARPLLTAVARGRFSAQLYDSIDKVCVRLNAGAKRGNHRPLESDSLRHPLRRENHALFTRNDG